MTKDLTKQTGPKAPKQAEDAPSRLKHVLMEDALGAMLGEGREKTAPEGPPRVIFALANFARSVWDRAKTMQQAMFTAAAGSGLEMKFAFYGAERANSTRRCRITTRWITNPDDMAAFIDERECCCGCYLDVSTVLAQAEKEATDRPLRAMIVIGDAFHDSEDDLAEAAISATRLRQAGTRLFLIQLGDDPDTTRRLKYLATVSRATHFRFDLRTQERQFLEMWRITSAYAAGGEEAVKATGGQAATLLLEQLKQEPMPIIEKRARARVKSRSGHDDNR